MQTAEQRRASNAKYYAKNKQLQVERSRLRRERNFEFIREKKNVPCADCGQRFHFFAMDFDHVKGTKVLNVSELANRGAAIATLEAEINKCVIVCANCHRIRTWNRIQAKSAADSNAVQSRVAQWQSARLLPEKLLVRAQPRELRLTIK